MHDTAMELGKKFFETYTKGKSGLKIVDIGAQNVNGTIRSVIPLNHKYIGVDIAEAEGVDIIIKDPYSIPLEDNFADIVLCSSCFEHSEFFWLLFNEIQRILKPDGLLYLNVPSNGLFHRVPVDCWRFYPDSGVALQNWARRSGYQTTLLESFTGAQKIDGWNDFIAIFVKDLAHVGEHPIRIQSTYGDFTNGRTFETAGAINFFEIKPFANAAEHSEDQSLNFKKRVQRFLRAILPEFIKAPMRAAYRSTSRAQT